MAFIVLAYVPMIVSIGGRTIVRLVTSKIAKKMIAEGAKKLTKANFKKTFEFFRGAKKLKSSDKNKVLENLNIITMKVPKKVIPKKVAPKEVVPKIKKDWLKGIRKNEGVGEFLKRKATEESAKLKLIPKKEIIPTVEKATKSIPKPAKIQPAPISKVKESLSPVSATRGDKLVKDITKQTKTGKVLEQTKKIFAPPLFSKRGLVQYPAYVYGTKKAFERDAAIKEAEKKSLKEENQKTEIKEKKELYETKKKETTLGEIDLNTIAVPDGHIWKTDPKGDFIIP